MLKQYVEAIEKNNIVSKTDTKGIITFVSDEFCKISGYTKEELIGKNHNIVRDPSVPSSAFKKLWDIIKAKKTYKATVKNRAKNGSAFYVNTTVIPILDNNGNIVEYIAIRYDVTSEFILKDKLQEKQKMIFWQSRLASLGQMLANIAHQWRQPLTELTLLNFTMKKALLSNNQKKVLKIYDDSKNIIQNMSNTIDDFTNFFKPTKEKKYFSIISSIDDALSIFKRILKKEKISVKICSSEDIILLGISNELSQIFINLIQNSKDAFISNNIINRKIKITILKKQDYAILKILDNAGGISDDIFDKLFEPYFTTKHSSSGTGLGLFMSKMICEQGFNGYIDVKRKKDGLLFILKLPIIV